MLSSWPVRPKESCSPPTFISIGPGFAKAPNFLDKLPIEIVHHVLCFLPLPSYLGLASTCRTLHAFLLDKIFFNHVLKEMTADISRPLYWVRPATTRDGEVERARGPLQTWLPSLEETNIVNRNSVEGADLPLESPNFPFYEFIRECRESDSMCNRKRIWGTVKQLEEVWCDYRRRGWRVDRFATFEDDHVS